MPLLGPDEDGRPHRPHHLRIGEVVVERDPGQPLERLDVARPRPGHDVVRQLRPRRGLVPAQRLAVVPHELLVERRLAAAGLVAVGRPEARRVRGQRLVAEDERAVRVEAELELRVGEDDPARRGPVRAVAVERERDALRLGEQVGADQLGSLLARDVLVVARLRLRRRREDRLGQLLRLDEPLRQPVPADLAGREVVLPARAGEVAAHDALDRQHVEPPALHRARVRAQLQEVVRHELARPREPERGQAREHAPLVRDVGGQDDVEGRDPVARDEQEALLVECVDLADLSRGDVGRGFRHGRAPPGGRARRGARTPCRRDGCRR